MSEKKGFFGRLKSGLSKTRDSFVSGMNAVFSGFSEIDDDFYEELEEQLVMADIGMETTTRIIEDLQEKVKEQKIKEASLCRELLKDSIKEQMRVEEDAYDFENKKKKKRGSQGRRCISHGCLYLPGAGGACFCPGCSMESKSRDHSPQR